MYYCFKCHEKGSIITFVQKRLGLDFVDALKWLGAKAGVGVRGAAKGKEGPDPREPLWEVNATAAEYFRAQLWESDAGDLARRYLASRNVSREVAERFTLGFAPGNPAALRGHLAALGHDDERQLAAGLLIRREDRPDARPRF